MSIATRYNGRGMREAILRGEEPRSLTSHPRYPYLRAAYLSVPPWMDREELRWLHWCSQAWSRAMGREYVLDHIVPLTHRHVCGLTVPWNLRLVTRDCNATKGGRWSPDQMEIALDAKDAD
jgi:hypothetical protein